MPVFVCPRAAKSFVCRPALRFQPGLRMLTLRRLVVEENGTYSIVAAEERLLRYYANAIGGVE